MWDPRGLPGTAALLPAHGYCSSPSSRPISWLCVKRHTGIGHVLCCVCLAGIACWAHCATRVWGVCCDFSVRKRVVQLCCHFPICEQNTSAERDNAEVADLMCALAIGTLPVVSVSTAVMVPVHSRPSLASGRELFDIGGAPNSLQPTRFEDFISPRSLAGSQDCATFAEINFLHCRAASICFCGYAFHDRIWTVWCAGSST